jgi:dihydrodipicolinate synthase/N-acetylneuraminate lyase
MSLAGLFTGVGVALITIFTEDGSLDAGASAEHAARMVALGVRAVVVAGSTGEAASLSDEERIQLLRAVRRAVPAGPVPLVAGTGAPSARQAAALTRAACAEGADALLVLSPPGSNDVHPYYEAVARAAGDTPVLGYHYPAVSAPGIPVEILPSLPIAGCKDSSGSADRLLQTVDTWPQPVYVGSPALLAMGGPLGAAGAILALANVEPERCAAAFAGDFAAQRQLAGAHHRMSGSFPSAIKEMTAARFGTPTTARMG